MFAIILFRNGFTNYNSPTLIISVNRLAYQQNHVVKQNHVELNKKNDAE